MTQIKLNPEKKVPARKFVHRLKLCINKQASSPIVIATWPYLAAQDKIIIIFLEYLQNVSQIPIDLHNHRTVRDDEEA